MEVEEMVHEQIKKLTRDSQNQIRTETLFLKNYVTHYRTFDETGFHYLTGI